MRSSRLAVVCLVLLASGVALAQTAPPIVAVFRIEDKGAGLDDRTLDQLTSYLEATISEGNVYRIVPQATIKKALVEKKQESYQECYELSCQIELGRELAAEKSLSTAILGIGGDCTVTAALYDLKTQVSDATAKVPVSGCDQKLLREGIDKAATQLKAYRGGGDSGSGFQEGRIGDGGEAWQVGKGKKAIVSFEAKPVTAMVMVDGKVVCERTPCSRTVAEGLHEVAMLNERYQARRERQVLAKGTKVVWELKPNFGWLTVRSEPAGQSVLVNGESLGVTPLERRELAPGGYEVLVKSPCHAEAGERVVIALDEEKVVSVRLAERQAAVEVSAKDQDGNDLEAEVLVDGVRLGETPDTFKVGICARSLEVRHADKGSKQVDLGLSEREVKPVAVVLEPAPVAAPVEVPRPSDQGEQPAQPEVPAAPVVRTLYLAFKVGPAFDLAKSVRGEDSDWGKALFEFGSTTGMLGDLTFDVKVSDLLLVGMSVGFVYASAESDLRASSDLGLFDVVGRLGMILQLGDTVDMTVIMGLGASLLMSELTGKGPNAAGDAIVDWKFPSGYVGLNMRLALDVNWFFMDELGLSFEAGAYFDIGSATAGDFTFSFGPLINLAVGIVYSL